MDGAEPGEDGTVAGLFPSRDVFTKVGADAQNAPGAEESRKATPAASVSKERRCPRRSGVILRTLRAYCVHACKAGRGGPRSLQVARSIVSRPTLARRSPT